MEDAKVDETLLKIAKGIDDKYGCGHCPCAKNCHLYTQEECIDKIYSFLKDLISE